MNSDTTTTTTAVPNEVSVPLTVSESAAEFQDRRVTPAQRRTPGIERRQFSNSYSDLSPEAAELGRAIDAYKLQHHRRFINFEEILTVLKSLGYRKS